MKQFFEKQHRPIPDFEPFRLTAIAAAASKAASRVQVVHTYQMFNAEGIIETRKGRIHYRY